MLLENQIVKTTWNNKTRSYYESKGYVFTKNGDALYVKSQDIGNRSSVKIKVKCDYCGKEKYIRAIDYYKNTENGCKKYACSECGSQKCAEYSCSKRRIEYFNKFTAICESKGYEVLSSVNDYDNAYSKLLYKCPKHGIMKTCYADMVLQNSGCYLCGHDLTRAKLKRDVSDVISIVESKNGNKLLNPEEYKNTSTNNLNIICGSCGNEFTTSLSSIINSDGCCISCGIQKSSGLNKLTCEHVVEIVEKNHKNTILNPEEYVDAKTRNLKITCEHCGDVYITSLNGFVYDGTTRCRKCSLSQSKGEYIIETYLVNKNIDFELEKKFDDLYDIKQLRFDFYLPDYNMCIEFDGQQHFCPKYGEDSFSKTTKHDKMKNEYCEYNNIRLLRIPYYQASHIGEILDNEFDRLINNKKQLNK